MPSPARHAAAATSAYGAYEADARFDTIDLFVGERIGPDSRGSSRKAWKWGTSLILMALGGGWYVFGDPAVLPGWWSALTASLPAVTASSSPGASVPTTPTGTAGPPQPPSAEPVLPTAAVAPLTAPPPPPAASEPAASPELVVTPTMPPVQTIETAPAVKAVIEPPAPPPATASPHQKRAKAAGLHPDLSQVLLERLSTADYRNAGVAIKTALAETPDEAVFVWPRDHKPELALFKVRFVPGAAPGCRRYVVTVTKDRWLTTALPVEKCGAKAARPSSG